MNPLPEWLDVACDRLRTHCNHAWDSFLEDEHAWSTPIGELVSDFMKHSKQTAEIQLSWLMLFAVRRALPCWQIYCDTTEPIETVKAIQDWLTTQKSQDWSRFTTPAHPSYRGIPIVDCRQCDTSAVACSAAKAAEYIEQRNPVDVIKSLADVDAAFDQSPLGSGNHYRKWFIDVAIPVAFLQRDLTPEEQSAFLEFKIAEILKKSKDPEI